MEKILSGTNVETKVSFGEFIVWKMENGNIIEAKILKISNETLEKLEVEYYRENGDHKPRTIKDLLEVVT